MAHKDDTISRIEEEYKELNNQLVVPAYRQFCDEFELLFHFWDELPKEAYDPEVSLKEDKLQTKAISLFNKLVPEYVLFKNRIVSFKAFPWGGGIEYALGPSPESLLDTVVDDKFYINKLEKRLDLVVSLLVAISSMGILIGLLVLLRILLKVVSLPDFVANSLSVLVMAASFLVGYLLYRSLTTPPRSESCLMSYEEIKNELQSIRDQLLLIREDTLNPLLQRRWGLLAAGELHEYMRSDDVLRVVERIKKRIRAIEPNSAYSSR